MIAKQTAMISILEFSLKRCTMKIPANVQNAPNTVRRFITSPISKEWWHLSPPKAKDFYNA